MRTITFEFDDKDLERLDKLRAAGYKFVQVCLMDQRGRDRYVSICVHNPSQSPQGDAALTSEVAATVARMRQAWQHFYDPHAATELGSLIYNRLRSQSISGADK